jgi:uncharacterized membrane protein YphA (DoxX/SURF4 family)
MNDLTALERRLASRAIDLAARALLALPFGISAFGKVLDFPSAVAEQAHFGLPFPAALAGLTVAVQAGGAALLFWNRFAWLGAGLLAGFTFAATMVAHRYWTEADPVARFHAFNTFWEHAAIAGGLILTAVTAARLRAGALK